MLGGLLEDAMTHLARISRIALLGIFAAALWTTPARAEDSTELTAFDETVARLPEGVRSEKHAWVRCRDCPADALAPYTPRRRKDWNFHIAPYGWLAGNSGEVVVDGETTDLDLSFEDLFERANGGFQIYSEIRWKRLFIAFDGTWAQLGNTYDGRLFRTEFDVDQRIFDVRVGFEVLRRSLDGVLDPCCEPLRRHVVADVFVGARYWYTKTTLTFTGPLGRETNASDTSERWDPFIGARVGWNITRRLLFGLRGDIGGFGIGDAAQFAWQAQVTAGYRFTSWMTAVLGYRLLSSDTITGSGADRGGQDLLQHGPIIGLGFSF